MTVRKLAVLAVSAFVGFGLAACQTGGAIAPATDSGLPAVVKTDAGYVSGINGAVRSYKGIPFAAPPVGDLRWKAAQPAAAWEGIKEAKTFGPGCLQGRAANPQFAEDCLTLNVWTPAKAAGAKLPVYVWIHGGAYESGAGTLPVYDGGALASEGIVVVTINYRLGILGWFSHPELSAESPDHVSGNQGVTDMIQSLKWVQANIAAFGGDPGNVTIGGESAGGTSMGLLMISPKAKGLFQKAVAESPWGFLQPTGHLKQTWYGKKPAEDVGAAVGKLSDLRAKTALEAMALPRGTGAGATSHQVVDGVIIPDDPTTLLQKGQINPVKLIVGTNRDEGTIFSRPAATLKDAETAANTAVGPGGDKLVAIYGATTDTAAQDANLGISRDSLFTVGGRQLARTTDMNSDAWQYEFTRVSGAGERSKLGAFHGAEMPYFFRNLPNVPYVAARVGAMKTDDFNATDEKLSLGMSAYLLNFIKNGDPNGPGLTPWPKFEASPAAGGEKYMEFGADGFTVKSDLRKAQLDPMQQLFQGQYDKR
ncbi:MAG TPA: carboxylesterase family protein [Hyphomonadaceae bacterium]|nr:carboxylesterase family protein [Hyphomonadaceae bacterium]